MTDTFDNDLAAFLDPEAAASMERHGSDIKFMGPFEPAFRTRETGVWSRIIYGGECILAMDYATLVQRVKVYEENRTAGTLEQWREQIYYPERAAIVFGTGMQTNDRDVLEPYMPQQ